MSVPDEIALTAAPAKRGSKLAGFGLAWLVMVAGYAAEMFAVSGLEHSPPFVPLFLVPWVVASLVAIAFIATGRTRTAVGIAIGLGTVLVACVVLFMLLVSLLSNNFR